MRVRVPVADGAEHRRIHNELGGRWSPQDGGGTLSLGQQRRTETIIIRRGPGGQQPTDAAPPTVQPPGSRVQVLTEDIRGTSEGHARQQITVFTEELRFPPFIASIQLEDGRWATVSPPSGLWSPWHTRMLLTFLGTLALLLPLAWLMARRLARPIRLFAQAAERLGSNPHAPPLDVTGPAEVRNAARAFNDMKTQLNRYVEGRTQMVAAIAHDLRTPLTRLRFRAEQADPEIRDRMAEKRAAELAQTKADNLKALEKDRKQRAARAAAIAAKEQAKKDEAAKKNAANAMNDVAGKSNTNKEN